MGLSFPLLGISQVNDIVLIKFVKFIWLLDLSIQVRLDFVDRRKFGRTPSASPDKVHCVGI